MAYSVGADPSHVQDRTTHPDWSSLLAMLAVDKTWMRGIFNFISVHYQLDRYQTVALIQALLGRNVFITGGAGTGKSFVVNLIREALSSMYEANGFRSEAAIRVAAPTGLAAVNVNGVTLGSLCGMRCYKVPNIRIGFYPEAWEAGAIDGASNESTTEPDAASGAPDPRDEPEGREDRESMFVPMRNSHVREACGAVRTLIVDEVSMWDDISARQTAAVLADAHRMPAGSNPFAPGQGGRRRPRVQLILVGDFAQLPPVLPFRSLKFEATRRGDFTRFLFESPIWTSFRLQRIELQINHRTRNPEYMRLLEQLRNGAELKGVLWKQLQQITRLELKTGEPEESFAIFGNHAAPPALPPGERAAFPCVHNWNSRKMVDLPGEFVRLRARRTPDPDDLQRRTPRLSQGVQDDIYLKRGCSIIVLRNQWVDLAANGGDIVRGALVANGSIGTFVDYDQATDSVMLSVPSPTDDGKAISHRMKRTSLQASWDAPGPENDQRRGKSVYTGSTSQFFIGPANAVTGHKAQGQTIRVPHVVQLQAWDSGQFYVMASRAKNPLDIRFVGDPEGTLLRGSARTDRDAVRRFHGAIRRQRLPIFGR